MNKKLNTIALATTLASLGFCSLSFGWQTHNDSLVGAGIANAIDNSQSVLPPIVSKSQAAAEKINLPPIISGKLVRQVSAQTPGVPTSELNKFNQSAELKPLNSILAPSTPKSPNVYRPPAPPVARVAKAADPAAQGSGSRSPIPPAAGSSTRGALPPAAGSGTRAPLQPTQAGSGTRSVLDQPIQGGGSSTRSVPGQDFANGNQGFDNGNQGFDNGNQGFDNNTFFDQNPNQGAGFDSGPVVQDFGTFGSVSAATRYLYLDALVWTRGDGDITNSNFGSLNDFDFTGGFRATYGVRNDSTSGTEIGFLALPEVDQEISLTDPLVESPTGPTTGADLTVGFIPVGFGAPADAFTSATAQTQRKESDLYGLEFNRVNWGWDLIKTYTGVRYLKFDDSYNVTSSGVTPLLGPTGTPIVDGFGNTQFDTVDGDFTLDASNSLFGAHIGGELFYDTGYRWSASGIAKYGLFANFNDFDTNFNNGDFNASSESDNFTISSVLELGILAHYQLRTNIRFRTGYQALVISNVATVSDNIGIAPGQFTGVNATDSDDVVFHGFNFGLEFYR